MHTKDVPLSFDEPRMIERLSMKLYQNTAKEQSVHLGANPGELEEQYGVCHINEWASARGALQLPAPFEIGSLAPWIIFLPLPKIIFGAPYIKLGISSFPQIRIWFSLGSSSPVYSMDLLVFMLIPISKLA